MTARRLAGSVLIVGILSLLTVALVLPVAYVTFGPLDAAALTLFFGVPAVLSGLFEWRAIPASTRWLAQWSKALLVYSVAAVLATLVVIGLRTLLIGLFGWQTDLMRLATGTLGVLIFFPAIVVGWDTAAVATKRGFIRRMGLMAIGMAVGQWVEELQGTLVSFITPIGRLLGGFAVGYGLIVLWFAGVFAFAYQVGPADSFINGRTGAPWDRGDFWSFFYFSITTFPPLGYSEVRPNLPWLQFLAALEGIVNVIWTLVVFAGILDVLQRGKRQAQGTSPSPQKER